VAYYNNDVGFEVLTTVTMKSTVLWVVPLFIRIEIRRCFGGTRYFHLQGEGITIRERTNEHQRELSCFLALSLLNMTYTLKMAAAHSTETHHVPGDNINHNRMTSVSKY
jgi:hypothetical protein